MGSKKILAITTEALQLKDELFGLESIRDAEKKKEHDKLTAPEPTDILGRFWWEHDREKYIHDEKEAQSGNFNVPAYNFFKNVQRIKDKFLLLKKECLKVSQTDNPEDSEALERLNREVIEIGDYLSGINDISIIVDCYRHIELNFRFLSIPIVKTKLSIDAFNKNPSMQSYKELCSNRDFFASNAEYLAYEINSLQRDIARNLKPEPAHVESARALDKVLDSVKKDLESFDKDIDNLRYQHSAVLYDALDEVNADSYEGSIFTYLQFYWLITLSYLHAKFTGLSVTATNSAERLDSSAIVDSIDEQEEWHEAASIP